MVKASRISMGMVSPMPDRYLSAEGRWIFIESSSRRALNVKRTTSAEVALHPACSIYWLRCIGIEAVVTNVPHDQVPPDSTQVDSQQSPPS